MIGTAISLVIQTAGSAVWSLIGALFLRLSTRIVAGFKQPYGKAYLAVLLSSVGGAVLVAIYTLIATSSTGPNIITEPSYIATTAVIGIVCQVAILAYTIETHEGEYLSFLQTILVALLYNILSILIIGTILIIIVTIIGVSAFSVMGMQTGSLPLPTP
jgi:hypothetical protein